jgi:hypothetical protein
VSLRLPGRRAALKSLGLVATLLVVGCAGRPSTPSNTLIDALRTFHAHLQWENYGSAISQVEPTYRAAFTTLIRAQGKLTEWEIGSVDLPEPPGDAATVLARWSGYRMPDLTVRTGVWRESWRRKGEVWTLTMLEPVEQGL